MRKILAALAALTLALVASLAVAVGPVSAAPSPVMAQKAITTCQTQVPQAALCLYAYTNHVNMIDFWNSNEARNTCFPIEQDGDFRADSYDNNTRFRWRLFRTKTCGGSHMSAPPFTAPVSLPDGWINAVVAVSRTSETS